MKHDASRTLYAYWSRLRAGRAAPERKEIEPGDIRHILADTFILEVADRDTYLYRLAGTRLCSALCRELKGRNIMEAWTGRDREAVSSILAAIVEDGAAAVLGLAARNDRGQSVPAEMLFLPLRHRGPDNSRILGSFATMGQPYWLGIHPLVELPVNSVRLIWPDEVPSFIQATALAGTAQPTIQSAPFASGATARRQVGHLTVYEGGRN